MKPEIKQKWVEALRSGEYSQGKLSLYDGTNYCCLGVLCNLYMNEKNETWYYLTGEICSDSYYCNGESELLPEYVMDWAELNRQDPLVNENSLHFNSLVGLNDTLNYTFAQIADVIEAQF